MQTNTSIGARGTEENIVFSQELLHIYSLRCLGQEIKETFWSSSQDATCLARMAATPHFLTNAERKLKQGSCEYQFCSLVQIDRKSNQSLPFP